MMPKTIVVWVLIGGLLIGAALIDVFIYDGHLFLKRHSTPVPSAISLALEERKQEQAIRNLEKEFNLEIGIDTSYLDHQIFLYRLKKSPKLQKALKKATDEGLYIFTSGHFSVHAGGITINTRASDEEIIDFLLGTPAEKPAGQ